jgi:hypothetical protein
MPELIWDSGGTLVPQVAEAGAAAMVVVATELVVVPVDELTTEEVLEVAAVAAEVTDELSEEVCRFWTRPAWRWLRS